MTKHRPDSQNGADSNWRAHMLALGAALLAIVSWVLWFLIAYHSATHSGSESGERMAGVLGQLGDSFGLLNVIFTALAFVAVWWTGLMQSNALGLQKEALDLQKKELKDTKGTLVRQTFEALFFQMLGLVRELRDEISVNVAGSVSGSGRVAIVYFAQTCNGLLGRIPGAVLIGPNEAAQQAYGQLYDEDVYKSNEGMLGTYFRSLFHMFKLIDTHAELSDTDKRIYAKLARAQLSSHDLVVLAANACGQHGHDFRAFIERYSLLKHYPKGSARDFIERCFAASAFVEAD